MVIELILGIFISVLLYVYIALRGASRRSN